MKVKNKFVAMRETKSQLLLQIISHKEDVIHTLRKADPNCNVDALVNEVIGMFIVHRAYQKGSDMKDFIVQYCKEQSITIQDKSFVIGVYSAEKILS